MCRIQGFVGLNAWGGATGVASKSSDAESVEQVVFLEQLFIFHLLLRLSWKFLSLGMVENNSQASKPMFEKTTLSMDFCLYGN